MTKKEEQRKFELKKQELEHEYRLKMQAINLGWLGKIFGGKSVNKSAN